jgi:hypothetical protein
MAPARPPIENPTTPIEIPTIKPIDRLEASEQNDTVGSKEGDTVGSKVELGRNDTDVEMGVKGAVSAEAIDPAITALTVVADYMVPFKLQ